MLRGQSVPGQAEGGPVLGLENTGMTTCIFPEAKTPIVSSHYSCWLTSGDGSICSQHMGALDIRCPFSGVSHMISSHILYHVKIHQI